MSHCLAEGLTRQVDTGGRRLRYTEWASADDRPLMLMLAGAESEPTLWRQTAPRFSDAYRVIVPEQTGAEAAMALVRALGAPAVLMAHGDAADPACEAAHASPSLVSGLVLANPLFIPHSRQMASVRQPVLIIRGRQSARLTHREAVELHGMLPHSRLVEPEDCGEYPFSDAPEAFDTAVRWFLAHPPGDVIEYASEQ